MCRPLEFNLFVVHICCVCYRPKTNFPSPNLQCMTNQGQETKEKENQCLYCLSTCDQCNCNYYY